MEYHGKFEHTLGRIHHISIMSIIDICYTFFRLVIQTLSPTLPGFQGLNIFILYLSSRPHKPIFILLVLIMYQISSDLHVVVLKFNTTQPIIV